MSSRAKKAPRAPATKPIFAGCVVALAGSDLGRENWKEADVARWVAAWGGAFSADVDGATTTHLLATAAQYQDPKNKRVGRAKRLLLHQGKGKATGTANATASPLQHIVTPDWLEDSITKKKRLPEKQYSLREAQRRENAQRRREERVERGIEKGKRLVNDCINHIYCDRTFFRYEIELTRNDEESGNVGQKYQICVSPFLRHLARVDELPRKKLRITTTLPTYPFPKKRFFQGLSSNVSVQKIWESHGKPHHYQMTAKYYSKPRDSQPAIHRFPEETPALFDPVFDHFKRFFRKKTKIEWDERLAKVGSRPKKYWQYQPPTGGKPVGLVKGELPSIFGDGSNIVIHRDEDSNDGGGGSGSHGNDTPVIANQQTTATAGETTASPDTTGLDDTAAAEIFGDDHGDDDVVMTDASAQQLGNPDPPIVGDENNNRGDDSGMTARVMMLAEAVEGK
ncbi:hypothetical protein SLS62_009191 [Diatrype stigma]|uniref:BRCT domain-containing protein n=1 Tax=Diatrype stigma TaxID=117547 RepID=A0AAN9UHM0_9PEZI